uniref:G-protein coupled receptors family 1 profile domain-containing protein n=1 Tax=Crocodylus porosus TaxID=8502 RepID=A0A7M4ERR8_CROPO
MLEETSMTLNTTSTESSLGHNNTHNGTHCEPLSPRMTKNIVAVLICLFGLMGNGIVLWFFGCRIKRNPFTVYILNLAVTDLGFLLSLAGFLIILTAECFTCEDSQFDSDIYLLAAISTERCLSVLCPIWHKIHHPKHLSGCLCALLWTFSFLMNGLRFIFCSYGSHERRYMTRYVLLILNFPIITPIMVVSNLILFIRIQYISQHHQPGRLYIAILSINPVIYFLVGSYRKWQFRHSVKLALQRAFYEREDWALCFVCTILPEDRVRLLGVEEAS